MPGELRNSSPPASAGSSRSAILKQFCRGAVARGLHHFRLLGFARRLAHDHSFDVVPGSGLPRIRPDSQSKFGILCYHRVGIEGVPMYSRLRPKTFEAQMDYLKKHYRLVPLGQLCRELQEARRVPPTLAITFDDGYRDLHTYAFPVLQRYSIPATIYLIGRCMETGEAPWYDRIFLALQTTGISTLEVNFESPRRFFLSSAEARMEAAWEIVCFLRAIPEGQRRTWCAEMERRLPLTETDLAGRMLDWEQVRAMHHGGVDFGAHTMTHPVVSRLESTDFPEELARSKRLLENGLDAAIEDFAYPFGKLSDLSSAAEKFLAKCSYRSAATTIEGYNSPGANPFGLRRMQIGDGRSLANFSFDICRMFLNSQGKPGSADVSLPDWQDAPLHDMAEREGD